MNSPAPPPDTQLATYVSTVRRRIAWFLTPILIVPLVIGILGSRSPDSYAATTRVLLSESAAQQALDGSNANASAASRALTNEIDLARGDDVKEVVLAQLGLLPKVTVKGASTSDVLTFTATAGNAEDAALFANTWAQAYVDDKRSDAQNSITAATDSLRTQLEVLRDERQVARSPLDDLEDRIAISTNEVAVAQMERDLTRLNQDLGPELDLIDTQIRSVATSITNLELGGELAATGTARIIQQAAVPSQPTNTPLAQLIVLGVTIGSVLGIALALARENLDDTIQSAEDVARMTALPVLGTIPRPDSTKNGELALESYYDPNGPIADAYHKVRTALQFAFIGRDIKSIVVTSPNQSDGKTTTSTNLAWALSSSGGSVGLVDVDFRRPRLHDVLGIGIEPGLSNYFIDKLPLEKLIFKVKSHDELCLFALPSGTNPPNPAELIAAPTFSNVIHKLKGAFDLTIFDAPPVLPVSDALAIARHADTAVVVVRAGSTKRQDLLATIDSLNQVGAGIAGIVLVGVSQGRGYGYGYGYGYSNGDNGRPVAVEPLKMVHTETLPQAELSGRER